MHSFSSLYQVKKTYKTRAGGEGGVLGDLDIVKQMFQNKFYKIIVLLIPNIQPMKLMSE